MKPGDKPKEVTLRLPVELSDHEIANRGLEAARISCEELRPLEQKIRELNQQRKELRGHMAEMLDAMFARTEVRPVKCLVEVDWQASTCRTVRLDTGETVPNSERTLTAEERQQSLFDDNVYVSDEESRLKKAEETLKKIREGKLDPDADEVFTAGDKPPPPPKTSKKKSRSADAGDKAAARGKKGGKKAPHLKPVT